MAEAAGASKWVVPAGPPPRIHTRPLGQHCPTWSRANRPACPEPPLLPWGAWLWSRRPPRQSQGHPPPRPPARPQ